MDWIWESRSVHTLAPEIGLWVCPEPKVTNGSVGWAARPSGLGNAVGVFWGSGFRG